MYILIVEDDPDQFKFICDSLKDYNAFPKARIKPIASELEFRKRFEEIGKEKPDVIIMDIMLRWADLGRKEDSPIEFPPKEIKEEGFYRAGIRCVEMLAMGKNTKDIPIILYSILDIEDLESDLKKFPRDRVKYIIKDFDAEKIVRAINSF
ncbi:MAG: hypothetical protein WBD27_00950 [Pyrinomonadaceae bacterium]